MSPRQYESGWQPLSRPLGRSERIATDDAFGRLALAHASVMAADAMVTVALAGSLFFSIKPTDARGKLAFSLLFTMAPFAVVAPFLGPAIDRSRAGRKLMIIGAALGRAAMCLLMAVFVKSYWLFPIALVLLVLSKGHSVAKSALVPAAVARSEDLVEANSKLAMLAAVVGFAAAAPAVGILKLAGAPWVLRTASVVYLCGAAAAVRCRPAPPAVLTELEDSPGDEMLRSRGVVLAAWSMAVLRGVVGFLTFAVAFEFRRTHAPSWWFGIILSLSLFGGFLGAFIGPRLRAVLREENILVGSLGAVAVMALVATKFNDRIWLSVLALVVGMSASTGRLAFDSIVQRDGAERSRGRSFARFEAIFQLVWVASALIPVVLPIPNRLATLLLAVATASAGLASVLGRRAATHAYGTRATEAGDVGRAGDVGQAGGVGEAG